MRLRAPTTPAPGGGVEAAFHLDMLSSDELAGQGVSLLPAATPPSVNQGLVLNGVSQYATVPLAWYATAFEGGTPGELSVYAEFNPPWAYNAAGNDMALFDGVPTTSYMFYFQRSAPNYNIMFFAGSGLLATIGGAAYGALWRTGLPNKIAMRCASGSSAFYLNGAEIGTSVAAWTRALTTALSIGSSVPGGSTRYFQGTVLDFRIYNRKLTSAEALQLTTLT